MKRFIITFLLCAVCGSANAQGQYDKSYRNYVLYVYHIAKYVEWNQPQKETFDIFVVGNSRLAKLMEVNYHGRTLRNASLVVHSVASTEQVDDPDILFISRNSNEQLGRAYKKFGSRKVLIMADFPGAATEGAAINFFTNKDDLLRFQLNRKTIRKTGLQLNNSLLALAELI